VTVGCGRQVIKIFVSKWRKFETDAELLTRYKHIEADKAKEGKTFDLNHELCAEIARRDCELKEKNLRQQLTLRSCGHYIFQLVLIGFICANWDDLKIVLVLCLVMLWRSLNYNANQVRLLQTRTIEWLTMAHPTAKDDFFKSERCYGTEIRDRVYKLLHPQTKSR
jgi:hypothetical protein